MELTSAQSATLAAAIDRIVPADDWPSAGGAGVMHFLLELFDGDAAAKVPELIAGLDGLDAESRLRHRAGFASLSAADQDSILIVVEDAAVQAVWSTPPDAFFQLLLNVTTEGYYADTANGHVPASWAMIGYDPGANRP